ncbi:MAG: hypothetical protein H6728_14340 [Myxococcales bacterium]|nr:hypothetical protein [Myxococcales bacterium]MCB9644252.1 hypothetical protein [Myxococcales bacterium]
MTEPTNTSNPLILPEIPRPLLLNSQKHHIETSWGLIQQTVERGEEGMDVLAKALIPLGQGFMDFYHGALSLAEVCSLLLALLKQEQADRSETYRAWVAQEGSYRTVTLEADESIWVFFPSDGEERFAHLHPARYSPHTIRVRANTLKTVISAIAYAKIHSSQPRDIDVVNAVRTRWMGLSPLPNLEASAALESAFQIFGV